MSNRIPKKQIIECGFGENCARLNCTFKHPDSRNLDVNLRKVQEEQRKKRSALEQQQMELIERECRHGDLCAQLSCPYRHSPAWNPVQNQQLAEEKRRQNELRREKQQQQALNVCNKEAIDNRDEVNRHQQRKNSMSKNSFGDDYQYDDEYFNIQEKIWKKQKERQIDKW